MGCQVHAIGKAVRPFFTDPVTINFGGLLMDQPLKYPYIYLLTGKLDFDITPSSYCYYYASCYSGFILKPKKLLFTRLTIL